MNANTHNPVQLIANHGLFNEADHITHRDQAKFEGMFNAMPDGVVFMRIHGEIMLVNPAFTALFGYSSEEVIGQQTDVLYASREDYEEQRNMWFEGNASDKLPPFEVKYRKKNGSMFVSETVVTVVKDAEDNLLGYLAIIRDITERKQAAEILKEHFTRLAKKNRYESIMSTVTRSVHQSTNLQDVMDNAVEAMSQNIDGIDVIEMFLVEGEEAVLKAHIGLPDWLVQQIRSLPYPQGYTWQVIINGKPRYCKDVDEDMFIHPAARAFGIKSYLSMPITYENKTVGCININSFRGSAFDEEELKLLEIVSQQIETAINNAQQAEALRTALLEVEQLKNRLQAENVYLQEEIKTEHNCGEIVGQSVALRKVLRKVEQVAPTDATVLIQGETGTGKELLAHAIHNCSRRRDRPLVKVNCAALPAGLIESELFGHEKGAFTGALTRKIGRFELADGGTLFLDEMGDLPLELQAKLLRVLQEGEFERLGDSHTLKVDVRVIAATNRDLAEGVKAGTFRSDLFGRLNVFPLTLPPLRDRQDDIPLLVNCVLNKYAKKLGKPLHSLSQESMARLLRYSWPGNIRELQNVIERAAILARGPVVEIDDSLDQRLTADHRAFAPTTLQEMERAHILRVLQESNWVVEGPRGAALILGLHPNTLRSRLQKLGIKKSRSRP